MSSVVVARSRYHWNVDSRLQLVKIVKEFRRNTKNVGLRWGEVTRLKWGDVARRVGNDAGLDESTFSRLCAKQFDNLYRAYMKFKQDGDQPPRLTKEIIKDFDEITMTGSLIAPKGGNGGGGDKGADARDDSSKSPDVSQNDAVSKCKAHGQTVPKISWTNSSRVNLLQAVRDSTTGEGKIQWTEVASVLQKDLETVEDVVGFQCMQQFTDLSLCFKEFKALGERPRRLTVEIIEMLEALFEAFPNLNPSLEVVGEENIERVLRTRDKDPEIISEDRHGIRSSPAESWDELTIRHNVLQRPSSRGAASADHIPRYCLPRNERPTSPFAECIYEGQAPAGEKNRPGSSSKNKEIFNAEFSSNEHDNMPCGGDYKDEHEVGLDRMAREVELLQSWFQQEVIPVGKEVLARLKAHGGKRDRGRDTIICKRRKTDDGRQCHDDLEKLISEASQRSTILSIRSHFQQARAHILKEVKEAIERVGSDLFSKSSHPFQESDGVPPSPVEKATSKCDGCS